MYVEAFVITLFLQVQGSRLARNLLLQGWAIQARLVNKYTEEYSSFVDT